MQASRFSIRTPTALLYASAALALLVSARPAHASEGGASFYLLGTGGPNAAILPPIQGIFFDNTFYFYDGKAGGNRQFVIGGNLVAGIDATIYAGFPTLLWVPTTDALGGTLALGASLPIANVSVDVAAQFTGPRGNVFGVARKDDATILGDPVATASLGWNVGNNVFVATSATVNIPVGQYREDQLANLAFHRWIVDTSAAVSWHDAKAGWDVSGKVGLTFNGTNHFTNYDTGTEFHAEASVEKTFSPELSVGVQAYHFQQVSGDSGEGAVLGSFKGRVSGVGATAAYNFKVGKVPVTARVRVFDEFNVKNRLDGQAAFFSLTFPLKVKMPAGAPHE